MPLVDERGNPIVQERADGCPKCGAREKDIVTIQLFGGHSRTVCQKCGHEFESRRD